MFPKKIDEHILDMCAAPGGKTTHIAALMKNTGILHANDKNEQRIRSLVANIHRMGVRNTIVSQMDGRDLPTNFHNFDRVLLDAPCMGLGVISKDRNIKSSKSEADMNLLVNVQLKLLLAAIDCVDFTRAGIIVYSTCSITVEENEAIIEKALKKRYVRVVDAGLPFGIEGITNYRGKNFHPSLKLARRYYPHSHNIDGFFVCKLQKYAKGIRSKAKEVEEALLEKQAPLVLRKNFEKLLVGESIKFEDDREKIDFVKEEKRTQRNKQKQKRKQMKRKARMNGTEKDDEDEEIDTIPPPQQKTNNNNNANNNSIKNNSNSNNNSNKNSDNKVTTEVPKTSIVVKSTKNNKNNKPKEGKDNTERPKKRLRGSKQ